VVSAAISSFEQWLKDRMPGLDLIVSSVNFTVSLIFIAALFAAIYKILPDRKLQWRDVFVGAVVTALLFSLGKMAISFYIGRPSTTQGFGAAGALAIVLLWLYYSAVIFLLGAEFTRAWSGKAPAAAQKPPPVNVETLPDEARKPIRAAEDAARRQDETQAAWIMAVLAAFTAMSWRGRRARPNTGDWT